MSAQQADKPTQEENEAPSSRPDQILSLLRIIEKEGDDVTIEDSTCTCEQLIEILGEFDKEFHERGLFLGDVEKSNAHTNSTGLNAIGSDNKHRRKRRKYDRGAGAGSTHSNDGSSASGKNREEEELWLSIINRIISGGDNKKKATAGLIYPPMVIEYAANILNGICTHCALHLQTNKTKSSCARTELEMMAPFGQSWLTLLIQNAQELISWRNVDTDGAPFSEKEDLPSERDARAACSCIRACASIVRLLGTRLSRCKKAVITTVHSFSYAIMGCTYPYFVDSTVELYPELVPAAAELLASLYFTGNSSVLYEQQELGAGTSTASTSPSELFHDIMVYSTQSINLTLHSAYPPLTLLSCNFITKPPSQQRDVEDDHWHVDLKTDCDATTQHQRRIAVLNRIRGSVLVLISLWNTASSSAAATTTGKDTAERLSIPLMNILHTIELLIKFGSNIGPTPTPPKEDVAKNWDGSTSSPLLTSHSAKQIMNTIRSYGQDLFQEFLTIVGPTHCLKIGKEIVNFVQYSISSSFPKKQNTNDHKSSDDNHRKLQCKTMKSMQKAVQTLGCSAITSFTKSAVTVGTNLAEIMLQHEQNHASEETLPPLPSPTTSGPCYSFDAVAETAAETLSLYVSIGNGFIPSSCRSYLETVFSASFSIFLNDNTASNTQHLFSSAFQKALLQLSINILCTSWQDGGTTHLIPNIRQLATLFKTYDDDVASLAFSTIAVCDSLMMPRAPPLLIPSRKSEDQNAGADKLATELDFMKKKHDWKEQIEGVNSGNKQRDDKDFMVSGSLLPSVLRMDKMKEDNHIPKSHFGKESSDDMMAINKPIHFGKESSDDMMAINKPIHFGKESSDNMMAINKPIHFGKESSDNMMAINKPIHFGKESSDDMMAGLNKPIHFGKESSDDMMAGINKPIVDLDFWKKREEAVSKRTELLIGGGGGAEFPPNFNSERMTHNINVKNFMDNTDDPITKKPEFNLSGGLFSGGGPAAFLDKKEEKAENPPEEENDDDTDHALIRNAVAMKANPPPQYKEITINTDSNAAAADNKDEVSSLSSMDGRGDDDSHDDKSQEIDFLFPKTMKSTSFFHDLKFPSNLCGGNDDEPKFEMTTKLFSFDTDKKKDDGMNKILQELGCSTKKDDKSDDDMPPIVNCGPDDAKRDAL